jgi:hypothetical protein
VLRDSLENLDEVLNKQPVTNSVSDVGKKATVENEDGETLEVLYDPILKCYYEPKSNTYYELN